MSKINNYSGNGSRQEKNGYNLSRQIFIFSANNPGLVKPKHIALYFWIVELNNRLRWKDVFGLPTMESMKMIGIKDRRSYRQTLTDLEEWGFIQKIEKSTNQYIANKISLLIKENVKELCDKNQYSNRYDYWN